jgi:F-type H+-transporting ATPase subunit epsilon
MAEKLQFELVSPEQLLLSKAVDMVVVPGVEGDFGALPRHAPLISVVRPGVIDVHEDGKVTNRIFVAGGFAEVNEERCTVLAEEAFPLDTVTREAAEARLAAARGAVSASGSSIERTSAERELSIAEALRGAVA